MREARGEVWAAQSTFRRHVLAMQRTWTRELADWFVEWLFTCRCTTARYAFNNVEEKAIAVVVEL